MAKRAPGKRYRKGMTITQLLAKFPDDATGRGLVRQDPLAE